LRGQVRRTIWLESLSVATLGVVLGGALGAINLFYILQMARHDIVGMPLDYVFPGTTMLALIPIMLGAGVVAAVWPAESAVRGSLVEALEYE
jgi:putative ABC transport system permease protein